jgi:protein-S-isoprenylcysteine O-methyltransferase Ste14
MEQLLRALGRRANILHGTWVISTLLAAALFFVIAKYVAQVVVHINPLGVHIVGWVIWFSWQGWLFPLNRERYIRTDPATSYRKAFYRDILPGASLAASQAFYPVFYGYLTAAQGASSALPIIIGVICIGFGALLVYYGFRTIGIAAAGFVFEYQVGPKPLVMRCVYGYLRHPIFCGGIIASFGSSLLSGSRWSLAIGMINLATLPVYWRLEDARLIRIFGDSYLQYRSKVHPFVPRVRAWKSILGSIFNASSALPKYDRKLATSYRNQRSG